MDDCSHGHDKRICEFCELDQVRAERDWLRAVVDAARMVLTVIDSTPVGQMVDGIEGHDEITLLRLRLDQLDRSAEAADG